MKNIDTMRMREIFDSGWAFYKGDIHIPQAIKGGVVSGYTDTRDMTDRWFDMWLIGMYKDVKWRDKLFHEWVEVDLPHDWCVEQDYINDGKPGLNDGNPGTGININGYLPYGVGCYRKTFNIPASDKGKMIYIEFDGISRNSTIWINGYRLGTHYSGYTSFNYDITDVALYGDEGKNTIFVKVDASEPEGWWYEGSGIYRHVWLVKCDRLHVAYCGTFVTTPTVSEHYADVNIRTKIQNDYPEDKTCVIISTIMDTDNRDICSVSMDVVVSANGLTELQQPLKVENPSLWSPDSPYLYNVVTEIKLGEKVVDTYTTTFGIRTFDFNKDDGFFLNGKPLVIKGICCHQDFAGLGVALPDGIIEYKMQLLKETGANAYRSAHNPATSELLDICDRLGIMVMEENRRLDSTKEGISELESMLYRDRNHPSIILWSMHNEELLEGTEMGKRVLKTMVDITHKIDPTRPTTAATLRISRDKLGYCEVLDIVGCNYNTKEGGNIKDRVVYSHRKMINSENIALIVTRGVYVTDNEKGHKSSYGNEEANYAIGDNSPEHVWKDLMEHPYMSSVFIWTGFDYRGECKWPNVTSQFGIMDTCGFPKDIYYYWKSQWTDEPMVHVFPHWNWHGREGEEIDVWIYTNCDSVELFLNRQSLGEKEIIPYTHLVWKVKYAPGELSASGMKNGRVVVEKKVVTASGASKIFLFPHKTTIKADGCDVSVIRVSIHDDSGYVVPLANNKIKFIMEGPGKILGVGNGDPSSLEADKSNIRRAFNGHCAVIVQSGRDTGKIALKAESAGLISASVTIDTV